MFLVDRPYLRNHGGGPSGRGDIGTISFSTPLALAGGHGYSEAIQDCDHIGSFTAGLVACM
jgi:hypothetical protein